MLIHWLKLSAQGPRGPGASRYVYSVVRRRRRRRRRRRIKGRLFLDEIFSAIVVEVTREVGGRGR